MHENRRLDEAALTIPWQLRPVARTAFSPTASIRVLSSRYFWWKILYAFRMTVIACLPAAVLIAAPATSSFFASKTFAIIGGLITTRETVGQSLHQVVLFLKSIPVVLLATSVLAHVELFENMYAWSVVYTLGIAIIALLHDELTKRLGIVIFNVCLISQVSGHGRSPSFPIRITFEYFIGAMFAVIAALLPWPKYAKARADSKILEASRNISLCFNGICDSFWSQNNLQRRINMVRIQYARKAAADTMNEIKVMIAEADYEWQPTSAQSLRQAKYDLLSSLVSLVDAQLRIIESISEDPFIIHGSALAEAFGTILQPYLLELAAAVDEMLLVIAKSTSVADLHTENSLKTIREPVKMFSVHDSKPAPFRFAVGSITGVTSSVLKTSEERGFQRLLRCLNALEGAFLRARRSLFYGEDVETERNDDDNQAYGFHHRNHVFRGDRAVEDMDNYGQEFPALMAFYLFTVCLFAKKTSRFIDLIDEGKSHTLVSRIRFLFSPAADSFETIKILICAAVPCLPTVNDDRRDRAVSDLIGAFKVSFSMGISMLFFYGTDRDFTFSTGPTIIAFVCANTSSEALYASMLRLFGTLFGAVVGFFSATLTTTSTEKVAALCSILFVCGFFRTGVTYGVASLYATFVVMGMLVPGIDSKEAISKIHQNTFSVIIYFVVSILFFPVKPMQMLTNVRLEILDRLTAVFDACCSDFVIPCGVGVGGVAEPVQETASTETHNGSMVMRYQALPLSRFPTPDQSLFRIELLLNTLKQLLAKEAKWMPLASTEPAMTQIPFPTSASSDFHVSATRMSSLLGLMLDALKLLRIRQGHPSKPFTDLLSMLAPKLSEAVALMKVIRDMMMMTLTEPQTVLTSEIVSSSLQFEECCLWIHHTKSTALRQLVLIGKERLRRAGEAIVSPNSEKNTEAPTREHPVTFSALFVDNEAVLPVRRHNSSTEPQEEKYPVEKNQEQSNEDEPFIVVGNDDVEGTHTFTICIVLFSKELKRLFVAVEAMQQHSLSSL